MRELTSQQRKADPYHHVDPGFINKRKCFSFLPKKYLDFFQTHSKEGSGHFVELANDHLLVNLMLEACAELGVHSLGEVLQDPSEGQVFSSTQLLEGNEDVYSEQRVNNNVLLQYESDKRVFLNFSTRHFVADTGKVEQSGEYRVSIIGEVRKVTDDFVQLYPMIMGAPSLDHPRNKDVNAGVNLMRYGHSWYQHFPEDIDEFAKCGDVSISDPDEWISYMRDLPEKSIKEKIADILNDLTDKDWGGEQDDHFTSSIHLSGERTTAAFLLKGPSRFKKMTPELLGKRADQIYRLAATPAKLLIVQHAHEIGKAVRATLRAFAVQPHNPRRYCLIDGRDTYKIFKAYGRL